ncbi:MBL fold metallo-hydrolase [Microaerobacter geothermalis]|uniref:MBL fold metallo-hydrolase n=1 Tax=Microaerobacter geothermalis TaxID=674972 RepID=UPI001F3D2D46|nr:MBL fold metallo-hydrolase [Microaerobacter geothermalis]MCF6093559.1 MBL fold metallo-hydrolase [Microaerobacter geothermalis]
MKIEILELGPLQTNAYLITNEQKEGIVIDPGMNPGLLLNKIKDLKIQGILLTHAHFDHMGGVDQVRKATGAPVYIHQNEADWLTDPNKNGSARWSMVTPPLTTAPADVLLSEEGPLTIGSFNVEWLFTPGHSPGGISLLFGEHVFTGDALFAQSIGRTDLEGGNYELLISSIQDKLMVLPDETKVYPGHGPATTIGVEKDINPFITGLLR